MYRRAVHSWKPRAYLYRSNRVGGAKRPHADDHLSGKRAAAATVDVGALTRAASGHGYISSSEVSSGTVTFRKMVDDVVLRQVDLYVKPHAQYGHRKHAHSSPTTPHVISSTHTCAVGGMAGIQNVFYLYRKVFKTKASAHSKFHRTTRNLKHTHMCFGWYVPF